MLRRTMIVALFGLGIGAAVAEEITPQRMAFAISGGASKGAYEAGINWGLLAVFRAVSGEDPALAGRIRPIEMASIAGTSAGGINTMLSGLAWCMEPESRGGPANRIDRNIFRFIWLTPDINSLLPDRADSSQYLPDDAALSRRELVAAANWIRKRWRYPGFRPGCRVPLAVTVTRVEPEVLKVGNLSVENQRYYFPFELRIQADGHAEFFFNPADHSTLTDPAMILFPRAHADPAYSITDKQVLDAVLATSAFPAAFGRKRLNYCRLSRYVRPEPAGSHRLPEDTAKLLICPEGYELAEGEFADGGLFDNLPIGVARTLAETHHRAGDNEFPVRYIYLDPNGLRYELPKAEAGRACDGPQPPAACRTMEYSFFTEYSLLLGGLGTARKSQLYNELTNDVWKRNVANLANTTGLALDASRERTDCGAVLPYFNGRVTCSQALGRVGALLESGYQQEWVPVSAPFSRNGIERLRAKGAVTACRTPVLPGSVPVLAECRVNINRLREQLLDTTIGLAERARPVDRDVLRNLRQSRENLLNDRRIHVTNRGAPITGTLLGDFGAFLEVKFREYDYYVGIYDAIVLGSQAQCGQRFSPTRQESEFHSCRDRLSRELNTSIGVANDPQARYVFARLAQREFGKAGDLKFAYEPMPPEDRDMRIIFDGLERALLAGHPGMQDGVSVSVETTFFSHLKSGGFVPTPTPGRKRPLLAGIMDDPDQWAHEMTRRLTSRLVYLEREAAKIYKQREPNAALREADYTSLMGAMAVTLQTGTYKYPPIDLAPSTAPKLWWGRYLIPYEIAFDTGDGDTLLLWQPTIALTSRDNLAIRTGFGFAGGILQSKSTESLSNYLTLGLDYTRLTPWWVFSSWGANAAWFHNWDQRELAKTDFLGADVHIGLMKNRLRISAGVRDVTDGPTTWFLTLGVTDVPGLTYWLTR